MATKAVWGTYKKEPGKSKRNALAAGISHDHSRVSAEAVRLRRRSHGRKKTSRSHSA